ncbi:hypothetical protein M409DRAFT_27101 [Zasmidium cellare ATCC 36951]|uniref:Tyrosinase copper-binding domain-containing protein n=1 Tax=Zasmidium cellare ATCC 36951 TaxID=1080233 RepID=A0A6A6CAJ8_ZASCE|nr:uncharacterized protein M409DRAFT_27101 [Zasmidium cellare ATCC 36951]KAF2162476.1 hypothetical protein M409DRAFT_27101 [Zasmidium cellare ATCC 36951]
MIKESGWKPKYQIVPGDETELVHKTRTPYRLALVISLCAALIITAFTIVYPRINAVNTCSQPRVRREWRSLSEQQQLDYLKAVQCLARTPSGIHPNASLHDDFPWVHRNIGYIAHEAALFLPWHRYFVHIYETALQESCGYIGPMPYWDWSLDWETITHSPVLNDYTGFGGTGNENNHDCVEQGPFANMPALYNGTHYELHCLSRHFAFKEDVGVRHYDVSYLSPQTTADVLDTDDYMELVLGIEHGPHNHLPLGIGGDFLSFTAPAEPLFFLHHAQLDRLWWIWQSRSKQNSRAYSGPKSMGSNESASVDDLIPVSFPSLADDVPVKEVLSTQAGILCYTYDTAQIGEPV